MKIGLKMTTLVVVALMTFTSSAADKVRIGYWTSGVSMGYGTVLEEKHFLASHGIDAEFIHFPDVNAPIKALASGSIDLAFGAPLAGVFSSAAEGIPVKIFAATQPADVQFVVPQGSAITSLGQLKGKKVAMSPAGSSVAVIASTLLQGNHHISPDQFQLIGGNESRLAQFLVQKQVDAAVLRSLTIDQLTELKVTSLGSFAGEWQKLTHSDAVPYIGVGAVRSELIDQHPEVVARVIAALRDTLSWGKNHPHQVASLLEKNASLHQREAEIYVRHWESMNRVTFSPADIATLKRQHQVFVDSGTVKGAVPDSLYDDRPWKSASTLK